jgi:hypothetical protein
MIEESTLLGRVLRANTAAFTVGCPRPVIEKAETMPQFGGCVRAARPTGETTYGLIYNVVIEDDPFVRQLVAAAVERPEILEDQRQKHQVPLAVDVLAVGHGIGTTVYHRLPPYPPGALDEIRLCIGAEVSRFTERHDWMRLVLSAPDAPADQLLAAAVRQAAEARPPGLGDSYLIAAGRELARLLAADLVRLDGILGALR